MARIALVTGANRGLGLEIARQLLAQGLRVVLTGRVEAATNRALEALGAASKDALAVRLDVTDPPSIAAARRTVEERFAPVDVVVNNAAVLVHENDDPLSIPRDAFRATFDTNVFGAIEVCRVFVPPMAEQRSTRSLARSRRPIRAEACSSTRSIRDGSAPTWAASLPPGRSSRARRQSCGSRPCRRMARREDSSGIGGPFPGEGPPLGLLARGCVQLGVEESAQLIEARRRVAPRLVEHRLRCCLELPSEAALGRR